MIRHRSVFAATAFAILTLIVSATFGAEEVVEQIAAAYLEQMTAIESVEVVTTIKQIGPSVQGELSQGVQHWGRSRTHEFLATFPVDRMSRCEILSVNSPESCRQYQFRDEDDTIVDNCQILRARPKRDFSDFVTVLRILGWKLLGSEGSLVDAFRSRAGDFRAVDRQLCGSDECVTVLEVGPEIRHETVDRVLLGFDELHRLVWANASFNRSDVFPDGGLKVTGWQTVVDPVSGQQHCFPKSAIILEGSRPVLEILNDQIQINQLLPAAMLSRPLTRGCEVYDYRNDPLTAKRSVIGGNDAAIERVDELIKARLDRQQSGPSELTLHSAAVPPSEVSASAVGVMVAIGLLCGFVAFVYRISRA